MTSLPWWRALVLVLFAGMGTLGVRLVAAGVRALRRDLSVPEALAELGADVTTLALAQAAGFGAAIMLGLSWLRRAEPAHDESDARTRLGLEPVPAGVLLLAATAGAALQLPLSELANWVEELTPIPFSQRLAMQQMLEPRTVWEGTALIGAFVLVAPIAEELLFRGLLVPGLVARYGAAAGVGSSAALFGIMHGAWAPAMAATAGGLLLGIVRLRTGSTVPCIVLHAATNAIPVLVPSSIYPLAGFNVVREHIEHVPLSWLVPSALVAAAMLVLLLRRRTD